MTPSTERRTGPDVPDLRSLLAIFGTEHPRTLTWESARKPSGSWLQNDARDAILRSLDRRAKLIVSASAGKGDPSETPWIAIMRPEITTSPQSGVYTVYLFCPDRVRITLCIMLGVTRPGGEGTLRRAPTTRDSGLLRELGDRLRRLIPPTVGFDQMHLSIGGKTLRSNQYEVGFIYGKTYDARSLPPNNDLVDDLLAILGSYAELQPAEIAHLEATPVPFAIRPLDIGRSRAAAVHTTDHTDLEGALQRRERSSQAHERAVQLLASRAKAAGITAVEESQHIDLLVSRVALIEVKSLQRDDPQQIRDGIAQLLYYRFLYREQLQDPTLVLALGRKPGSSLSHLIDFAGHCSIHVVWQNAGKLEASSPLPMELTWLR